MFTKNDIIKMAAHVTRRGRGIPDRRLMHPYHEWGACLLFFFVIVALGVAVSASRFMYFSDLESYIEPNEVKVVRYKVSDMERVIADFNARQLKFDLLMGGVTPPAPVVNDVAEGTSVATSTLDDSEADEQFSGEISAE